MVQINFAAKEVNCKIVYYGPGMSGKTANLETIYKKIPAKNKGNLTSISTEGDRTLFFDFLPIDLGNVSGMKTKFQLYTVPGQIYYSSTRRLVLQGVDGIVFIVDSQKKKLKENIESLEDLKSNLLSHNLDIENVPLIIQYNKRDLTDLMTIEFMEKEINKINVPYVEAIAITGEGVLNTLKKTAKLVLEKLNKKATYSEEKKSDSLKESEENICDLNGQKIPKKEFDKFCLTKMKIFYKMEKRLEDITNDEKKKLLDLFINQILIYHEAKKRNITVYPDEIDRKTSLFAKKIGTEEKFNQYLEQRNLTKEEIKKEVIINILSGKLITIIFPDYKKQFFVDNVEVENYYINNKKNLDANFEFEKEKINILLKNKKKKKLYNSLYSILRKGKQIEILN